MRHALALGRPRKRFTIELDDADCSVADPNSHLRSSFKCLYVYDPDVIVTCHLVVGLSRCGQSCTSSPPPNGLTGPIPVRALW